MMSVSGQAGIRPTKSPELSVPASDAPPLILVVDDEPRNIEVITTFLEREGFRVSAAEDGEQALAAVAKQPPDVILLDVIMPRLNGFETCRRLKANPATVFIPVVILTALRGAEDRLRGVAAGADDFLSKPFDHVELVTRARSLVRVKRLHDQVQAYTRELEARVAERTAELQQALAQLQELDRLKSEFIANVSHELRTPLLHVKGYIGLITDGALGPFTPEQARGLKVAQQAVEQLERVVQDVIDFRDLHERRLDFEQVPVADVCRNAIETLAEIASHKRIEVKLIIAPDVPPVLADRVALTRVVRHLLDNALKFSPSTTSVRIAAERREDRVRISIADQGPGISSERQKQIFDIFYQADGSTTRLAGGMGVGLAIVKVLLDAHHTQIRVDSDGKQGSTFYFDLAY